MARRVLTNGRIAFLAAVLLLGSLAAERGLRLDEDAGTAIATQPEAEARITGPILHLRLSEALPSPPDPNAFTLTLNDGLSSPAINVTPGEDGQWLLLFPIGAGSADQARLDIASAAGLPAALPGLRVTVETPDGTLPAPRYGAALAQAGGVAYLFGGHGWQDGTFLPIGPLEEDVPPTLPLDTILRVDLATGAVRTMNAKLPEGRADAVAIWDERPTPDCPAGCGYVIGGSGRSGERPHTPIGTILRYEPTQDVITVLPDPTDYCCRIEAVAAWTGTHAYIAGGGNGWVDRFEPLSREMITIGPIPPLQRFGMGAAFDARESALCPSGCMYLFGGADVTHTSTPVFHDGAVYTDHILRMAPREQPLSTITPVAARLPRTLAHAATMWDGERAYILGGDTCTPLACGPVADVVVFDPATSAVTTAAPLEAPIFLASAAWHEGEIVLLGGLTSDGETIQPAHAMMRYRPAS